MNVLLIEDEPIAARRLSELLIAVEPAASILAIIDSVQESVAWLINNPSPDLILMDINLSDGSCFSIFDVLEIEAPIVFCTAYDEYALKAFQSNGIAYLLKPVLEKDLLGALDKIKRLRSKATPMGTGKRLTQALYNKEEGYKSRFLVRAGEKLIPVLAQKISCFTADTHGVKLYFSDGDGHYLDYSVADLEAILDPKDFFRVSRQTIVSINAIESATAHARQTRVILKGAVPDQAVSRERVKDFRAWLER
jgi:two-component system response regulator LytT